jgi:hypothetical protein
LYSASARGAVSGSARPRDNRRLDQNGSASAGQLSERALDRWRSAGVCLGARLALRM